MRSSPTLLDDPGYARLKSFLIEATGLAYYETRDEQLGPMLQQRMGSLARRTCEDYLAYLQCHDEEVDRVVCDLTIGETYFFRHSELFDAIRDRVLPEVLCGGNGPLRIWSAGCSIGAEAYSLAILLRRDLAHLVGSRPVTIIGTDINRRFLARARKGRFGSWALRGVSDDILEGCFRRRDTEWEILPAFRAGLSFRHHNLVSDPFPADELAGFDVVLCRNVMIYFEPAVIHQLLGQFGRSVIPGGWFLAGPADPGPDATLGFEPVYVPGAVLHRRRDVFDLPAPPAPKPNPRPRRSRAPAGKAPSRPLARSSAPCAESAPRGEVRACFDRGEWDAGIALCSRAIDEDPVAVQAYYQRGLALEQIGKRDEAERDLRRVLYLDRSHAPAHFQLGRLLLESGRLHEAAPLLRAASRLLSGQADADPAGEGTDLTVGELRSLLRIHAGEAQR